MAQGFWHNIVLWTNREFNPEDWYGCELDDDDEVEMSEHGFTFVGCECEVICSCYGYDYCSCHNPYCACFADLYHITQPLVIASDGGCRYNGRPNAFAGIGVYVGEDSRYSPS